MLPVAIATIAATPTSANARTANLTREANTEHRRVACTPLADGKELEAVGEEARQQLFLSDAGGW